MGRSTFANEVNLTCKPLILTTDADSLESWIARARTGNHFVKRRSASSSLSPDMPRVQRLSGGSDNVCFGRLIAAGGNDATDAWCTIQVVGIADILAAGTAGALSNGQYDDYLAPSSTNEHGGALLEIPSTQPTTGNMKVIGGTVTRPRVIWYGFAKDIN